MFALGSRKRIIIGLMLAAAAVAGLMPLDAADAGHRITLGFSPYAADLAVFPEDSTADHSIYSLGGSVGYSYVFPFGLSLGAEAGVRYTETGSGLAVTHPVTGRLGWEFDAGDIDFSIEALAGIQFSLYRGAWGWDPVYGARLGMDAELSDNCTIGISVGALCHTGSLSENPLSDSPFTITAPVTVNLTYRIPAERDMESDKGSGSIRLRVVVGDEDMTAEEAFAAADKAESRSSRILTEAEKNVDAAAEQISALLVEEDAAEEAITAEPAEMAADSSEWIPFSSLPVTPEIMKKAVRHGALSVVPADKLTGYELFFCPEGEPIPDDILSAAAEGMIDGTNQIRPLRITTSQNGDLLSMEWYAAFAMNQKLYKHSILESEYGILDDAFNEISVEADV